MQATFTDELGAIDQAIAELEVLNQAIKREFIGKRSPHRVKRRRLIEASATALVCLIRHRHATTGADLVQPW